MNGSWILNPTHQTGVLPRTARDGQPGRCRGNPRGEYSPGQILSGQVDLPATNKLIFSFRGGYNYTNYNTIFTLRRLRRRSTATPIRMYPELPAEPAAHRLGICHQGRPRAGPSIDIYTRVNLNADACYMFNLARPAQHQRRLADEPAVQLGRPIWTIRTATIRYYWDQSYTCVTSQCSGTAARRLTATTAITPTARRATRPATTRASSSRTTGASTSASRLNLGLRTEREFLPSFSKQGSRRRLHRVRVGQQAFARASAAPGIPTATARCALRLLGLLLRRHEVRDAARQLRRRHLLDLLFPLTTRTS